MKKFISLALAVLMLTVALVACAKPADTPEDTTPAPQVADTTPPAEVATPEGTTSPDQQLSGPSCSLPEDLNFDDTAISILYWEDVEHPEFEMLEMTGDIVNDAIYTRNLNTETRLGVKLNFVGTKGNNNNQTNYINTALNSINAGGEHDIFAAYSMCGATLAVNGYAYNLNSLEYLDFEKPWWPPSLIDQASINGKLYFASGDISTNMLHMMYAVFFNKQLIDNYGLENPYELVDNGKWTHTKLFEMASNRYIDNNGDGKQDIGDTFGFASSSIHYDAFFTGAGLNTVEKDANEQLIISPTFNSEKTITLVENFCNFMWTAKDGYHSSTHQIGEVFSKNNTIFAMDRSHLGVNFKDQITFDYGIIPAPKFDEAQEDYITCLAFPYTIYAVSIASQNKEAAAATLECMAHEGYLNTTPALFEISMKLKYSSDNEASRMYDIIRNGVSIDIGRIFTTELQKFSYSVFRNACVNNAANTWASTYKTAERMMSKSLNNINNAIAALD